MISVEIVSNAARELGNRFEFRVRPDNEELIFGVMLGAADPHNIIECDANAISERLQLAFDGLGERSDVIRH